MYTPSGAFSKFVTYVGLHDDFRVLMKNGLSTSDADNIILAICVELKVDKADLVSKKRDRHLADARFIAFHLLRISGYKYKDIGALFNRDYSTVIHGVKIFNDLMEINKSFKRKVYMVKRLL